MQRVLQSLGVQPALVGHRNGAGEGAWSVDIRTHPGAHNTFGSKERHLGVVGDRTGSAIRRRVFLNAVGAIFADNGSVARELDGSAKRVAHSASQ